MSRREITKPRLCEDEIRPAQLKIGQDTCIEADVRWLLDRREGFVRVTCPACGSQKVSSVLKKSGFHYSVCDGCATMYMNPRPSTRILSQFYTQSQNYTYWRAHIFPVSESARRSKIVRPRAKRVASLCRKHGIRGGAIMEVGAGYGSFCEEIRNAKLFDRVIAVEPVPDLAAVCLSRGLEVIQRPIEEIKARELGVTVIVAFEVIEHLFCPRDFVAACAKALKPGGLLVLSCPNVRGFDIATLGMVSDVVDHEHLNYFNTASAGHLLAEYGFKLLEASTPGRLDAELVRNKVLAGKFDLSSQPFLKKVDRKSVV